MSKKFEIKLKGKNILIKKEIATLAILLSIAISYSVFDTTSNTAFATKTSTIPKSLELFADPISTPSNGSVIKITAVFYESESKPSNYNGAVKFSTNKGTLLRNTCTTYASSCSVYLKAPLTPGIGTVTAISGTLKASVSIEFTQTMSHAVCGSINEKVVLVTPTTGLCSKGTAGSVVDTGSSWMWTCKGLVGGSNVNCVAKKPPINGVCGSSNRASLETIPQTNKCIRGYDSDMIVKETRFEWKCYGINGGLNATCYAIRK